MLRRAPSMVASSAAGSLGMYMRRSACSGRGTIVATCSANTVNRPTGSAQIQSPAM